MCYILNLFKQTECVDRKSIHHKALQIQIEDTEYQHPEQRICENISFMKASQDACHFLPGIIQVASIDTTLIYISANDFGNLEGIVRD